MIIASDGKNVGGMEQQLALQALSLSKESKAELELSIVAHPAYRDLYQAAGQFYALNCERSRRSPVLLWQLLNIINKAQPDIIHCHGNKASSLLHSLRCYLPSCGKVASVHGLKKATKSLAWFEQLFAVSEGVQASLKPLASTLLENAVAPTQARPALSREHICKRFELPPNNPLFVSVGRLVAGKGFANLMQACTKAQLNLLVFGQGPLEDELAKLQSPQVKLAGFSDELASYYKAADALVINSEKEGFGLTLVEALRQRTLVFSRPISLAQSILPKENLLHSHSLDDLAVELADKLKAIDTLQALNKSVFDKAQTQFLPEHVAHKLLNYYLANLNQRQTLNNKP